MAAVSLNERCRKILDLLLSANDYIPLTGILSATGVSKRSVYYDLCKINEWLDSYGLPDLPIERGKGIRIPENEKDTIIELLEEVRHDWGYVFLPSERVKIIICCVIYSREPVYIEQLMEYCQVSRNTIFGDLRVVVSQLREYDLALEYETKKGYLVTGDAVRIRALFFLYFGGLKSLVDNGTLTFIDREEVRRYLKSLEAIEHELNVDYADGSLYSLAALLPIMYQNRGGLYFPGLKQPEIMGTREYGLIRKSFPDLDEKEQIYLCLHLLGSRMTMIPADLFEDKSNQSIYELTKALVTEFEKLACVNFEDKEELERALFVHITSSLYRYQYGIQIGSLMFEDIIREYGELFHITKVVCRYLDQMMGIPLPDSEVAYLALHFGAHLKIADPPKDRPGILIVCVNGISTGNMLRREVQKLLPAAKRVDVASVIHLMDIQEAYDLVISTVRIKCKLPVIVVHPILTDEDRLNILNHHLSDSGQEAMKCEALFHAVKKYVSEKDYAALRRDIVCCMQTTKGGPLSLKPVRGRGLAGYLDAPRITLADHAPGWQDSVRLAGACLLESGSIEKRYLDTIISQTLYYGTYMFLNEEVMLAHAKPEDGVFHTDVSLAIFRAPVAFMNNKRARFLFVLAAEDQEKHLNILKDIFRLVERQENLDKLSECGSREEVLELIGHVL